MITHSLGTGARHAQYASGQAVQSKRNALSTARSLRRGKGYGASKLESLVKPPLSDGAPWVISYFDTALLMAARDVLDMVNLTSEHGCNAESCRLFLDDEAIVQRSR